MKDLLVGVAPQQRKVWHMFLHVQTDLLHLVMCFLISLGITGSSAQFGQQPQIPEFLPRQRNITVREGGLAHLPCSIKNLGTKRVAWRRMDSDGFLTIGKETWVQESNFIIEHKVEPMHVSTWDLLIKNVKPEDAGLYECQITSTLDFAWHVMLNVVGPPILKPEERDNGATKRPFRTHVSESHSVELTGKEFVDHGEKIQLVCNATGGPHIAEDIDWFKDGDKIDSFKYKRIIVTKYRSIVERSLVSNLLIDRSALEDTGTYICRSSQDEIASIKVTVLIADTTNVKRGTNPEDPSSSQASWALSCCYAKFSVILSLTLSTLLSCSVIV